MEKLIHHQASLVITATCNSKLLPSETPRRWWQLTTDVPNSLVTVKESETTKEILKMKATKVSILESTELASENVAKDVPESGNGINFETNDLEEDLAAEQMVNNPGKSTRMHNDTLQAFGQSMLDHIQRKHHRARGGEPGTHKSNLEHFIFGEEIGRATQDASKHGEAHACIECRARSSSVLEVERLTAENSSLQGTIHSLQDDSNLTMGVLKSQLQKLQDKLSISSAQFQEVIPAIITELVHSSIIQVFYLSSVALCETAIASHGR
ncbi:unnamed protein product [Sphagnum troendelagicum]|uniref:Uncharacterized protein n=1 Tax=Sphagnum troendelagicum TaxID=128251 RepID=A0ABP0UMG0_9BRYO